MEAKLFFISIWCGVYGLILRWAFKSQNLPNKVWVGMIFNSLFWATAGVVLGMLQASYIITTEFQFKYSIIYAEIGIFYGAFMAYLSGKKAKKIFNPIFWGVIIIALFLTSPQLALVGFVFVALSGSWGKNVGADQGNLLKDNLEWADTGFSAILLASIVMFFVLQAFKIPSGSMRMTFVEGDHLFVNKFIYGVPVPLSKKKIISIKDVKQGDVVIFRFPAKDKNNPHYGKDFIKRVIALEGQTVEIVNKKVFVDGVKLEEPYVQHVDERVIIPTFVLPKEEYQASWVSGEFSAANTIRDNFGPIAVPSGTLFVMGDNRDRSFDGRFWGPMPLVELKGKAWLRYWPLNRFHVVH